MKTFWKRLLAVSLSAALLIGCAVSGLVLPAAAETTFGPSESTNLILNGDFEGAEWASQATEAVGYNGSKGVKITANTTPAVDFRFSKPLDTNKWYVFRFKAKGDVPYLLANAPYNAFNVQPQNAANANLLSTETWALYQSVPFQPTEAFTSIYRHNIQFRKFSYTSAEAVYFDDFELVEYYPGMNLMPGSDGELLPSPMYSTYNFFHNFLNAGVKISLTKDGDNNVWKFTDLGTGLTKNPMYSAFSSTFLEGKTIRVSFRYKADAAVKVESILANGTNATITTVKNDTKADANGWRTNTVDITAKNDDANWYSYLAITGTTAESEILFDDFTVREVTALDITTADSPMAIGESKQLAYTVSPANVAVTWTSTNPDAAVVDANGNVKAVGVGFAQIKATLPDGTSDVFNVKVSKFKNLITNGSFEGSEWTSNIEAGKGVNGGRAFAVTTTGEASTSASFAGSKLVLSESLKPGKTYVFRFKSKGGKAQFYTNKAPLYEISTYNKATNNTIAETQTDWKQWATTFTVTEELSAFSGSFIFYNINSSVTDENYDKTATVYYDEIEVFEYVPGFNVIDDGDGFTTPAWSNTSPFMSFANSFEVYNDNGNYVWKGKPTSDWDYKHIFLDQQRAPLSWVGKTINISFRYKVVNSTSTKTASVGVSYDTAFTNSGNSWNTTTKKVGDWTYVNATTNEPISGSNFNYQIQLGMANLYNNEGYVLIDDFYFGEVASSIDITTADTQLKLDETLQLEYTKSPEDVAVNWFSTDDSVAKVDANGKVTAVGYGKATIKAYLPSGRIDSVNVEVVKFKNLITNGDVDHSYWDLNDYLAEGKGVDGGRALYKAGYGSGTFGGMRYLLSEPLKANTKYIFRVKVSGGPGQIYSALTNTIGNNATPLKDENDWAIIQAVITTGANDAGVTTWNPNIAYYNMRSDNKYDDPATPDDTTLVSNPNSKVYYDEFELYEYIPGMNFIQSEDASVAIPNDVRQPLKAFANRMETYVDNGNPVWKFTPSSNYDTTTLTISNFFSWGQKITISYRYKAESGSVTITQNSYLGKAGYNVIEQESVKGADGWTSYKATVLLDESKNTATAEHTANGKAIGMNSWLYLLFSSTTTYSNYVLVDDFRIAETTSINIAEEEINLDVDGTKALTATVEPTGNTIVWKSSDEAVATVDQTGKVTAVGLGKATITAKLPDDKVDTCVVKVGKDFTMETLGLSVHVKDVVVEGEPTQVVDGIRFGTELTFGEAYKTDAETGVLQLFYDGQYRDVISMGMLLKRATNDTELKVENVNDEDENVTGAAKIWDSVAYSKETNRLVCLDLNDQYVEFVVNMMTNNPSETFNAREYKARGFVQLDGVAETIYTEEVLNSVNLALENLSAAA